MPVELGSPKVYVPLLIGVLLLFIPLFVPQTFILQILILIFFMGYLSGSWNIIAGYVGQVSLGHAAFVGVGAYTSTLLFDYFRLSPWIGLFIGGFAASLLSFGIGYPTLKLKGIYFALGTLAFSETLRILFLSQELSPLTGGAMGLAVLPLTYIWQDFQFAGKIPYYYVSLAMLVILLSFTYIMQKSRSGLYFVAIREDEDAAAALGINTTRYKLLAAAISTFFAGVGGVFYAQFYFSIHPDHIMGLDFGLQMIVAAQLGGLGTVFGPLLGSLFLTPLSETIRIYLSGAYFGVHLITYGAALCISVIALPKGIFPVAEKLYKRTLKSLPTIKRKPGKGLSASQQKRRESVKNLANHN